MKRFVALLITVFLLVAGTSTVAFADYTYEELSVSAEASDLTNPEAGRSTDSNSQNVNTSDEIPSLVPPVLLLLAAATAFFVMCKKRCS